MGWIGKIVRKRPRFIRPPGLAHYRFVRLPGSDQYEVWRDDRPVVGSVSGFTLDQLTQQYLETERKEGATALALQAGDPSALCALGWHREGKGAWFRLAAGRSDQLRVYRMGRAPFDYRCTTIWSHGNPPIQCAVCKRPIDA